MVQAVPRRGALPRPGGCSAFRPGGPGGLRGKPTRAPNWGASFFFAAPPAHRGGAVRQPAPVCNIDSVSWCDGESQRAPHVHRCRPTCKGPPTVGPPCQGMGGSPRGLPTGEPPCTQQTHAGESVAGESVCLSIFVPLSRGISGFPKRAPLRGLPAPRAPTGAPMYTHIYTNRGGVHI
jgi:hypothetical protein